MATNNIPESDEYLTTAEAGKLLAVHAETIRRMARAGALAFTKTMGGHYRVTRFSVLRWREMTSKPQQN